jgi:hypothetical protein
LLVLIGITRRLGRLQGVEARRAYAEVEKQLRGLRRAPARKRRKGKA